MPEDALTPLFDVFALDRGLARLLGQALESAPLDAAEYGVYSAIDADEHATVTSVAARLQVPLTTASDWVQTALARGHVRRSRSAADGRRYELTFTAEGARAFTETHDAFGVAYLAFLRHAESSPAEMRAVLLDMQRAIAAAADELSPVHGETRSPGCINP
ncbi:MarR family winged helix-turn-helix transcriptional regulator [Salana multivorans]